MRICCSDVSAWHMFEVPCTPLRDHTLYTSHLSHVDLLWYLVYVTIHPLHVDHAHEPHRAKTLS